MDNYVEVKATVEQPEREPLEANTEPKISPKTPQTEEKVEVIIKEIIRIKPSDFSAFKHALEEFIADWDV